MRMDSGKPIIIEFNPDVRLRKDMRGDVQIIRFGNDSIDARFVANYDLGGQLMMLKPGCDATITGSTLTVRFQGSIESVKTRHISQIREKGGMLRWP